MDLSILIAELPKAIPVLLGGFLAIAGGVAGHYLTHRFSAQRERNKLLREKAEQLIGLLYEHRDWLSRENSRLVFGTDLPEQPSPLDKAYALQALYFPELNDALQGITRTIKPIVEFFYKHAKDRIEDKEKWIASFNSDDFNPVYEAYLQAFHAAVKKVVDATAKRIET